MEKVENATPVTEYRRTVDAPDADSAATAVKALAKATGWRVRTVKAVRPHEAPGRWSVTLAVEPQP